MLIQFPSCLLHLLSWPLCLALTLDITTWMAFTWLPQFFLCLLCEKDQRKESVNTTNYPLIVYLKCIMKSTCKCVFDSLKLNCGYNFLAIYLLCKEDLCCCFLKNELTGRQIFMKQCAVLMLTEELFWSTSDNDRLLIY